MTAPVDLPADLSELDAADLFGLIGQCQRARYEIADAEGRLMVELDRREGEAA